MQVRVLLRSLLDLNQLQIWNCAVSLCQQKKDMSAQPVEGIRTEFYTDVKLDIVAGMEFGTKNYKMKVVGYEIFRLYFDSPQMDWQVGRQRVKRKIK